MSGGEGTCGGCGSGVDHDDHCCDVCAEAHDEAVRAVEREAIAAMAEDFDVETLGSPGAYEHPDDGRGTLLKLAAAIRARGAKP